MCVLTISGTMLVTVVLVRPVSIECSAVKHTCYSMREHHNVFLCNCISVMYLKFVKICTDIYIQNYCIKVLFGHNKCYLTTRRFPVA